MLACGVGMLQLSLSSGNKEGSVKRAGGGARGASIMGNLSHVYL